ncbi:MAG: ABC transporter ATP-binding protein [Nitrospinae bacterium]|nr:ABC transporter ATP-binding protein [Nitrospinota bacterium]
MPEETTPFIKVEAVHRRFLIGGKQINALNGVSLTVERGEIVGFTGVSGAGKTTLLYVIGALDKPTSGRVLYDGRDVFAMSEKDLAAFRSRRVGFVFQSSNLLPEFTAEENVALAAMIAGENRRDAIRKADDLLNLVGLSGRRGHRPGELSGGEQQRVSIARALVNNPSLVLADEPTGNLDTVTGEEVFGLIRRLNQERGQTFVVVTHNLALAARMTRSLSMRDGGIVDKTADVLEFK